jgi:hypothetical protein
MRRTSQPKVTIVSLDDRKKWLGRMVFAILILLSRVALSATRDSLKNMAKVRLVRQTVLNKTGVKGVRALQRLFNLLSLCEHVFSRIRVP